MRATAVVMVVAAFAVPAAFAGLTNPLAVLPIDKAGKQIASVRQVTPPSWMPELLMGLTIIGLVLGKMAFNCMCKHRSRDTKAALKLEKSLEHSYPTITAVLCLLVVSANVCLIVGMVLSGDSIKTLCDRAADGAAVVAAETEHVEGQLRVFQHQFNNYSHTLSSTIPIVRNTSRTVRLALVGASANLAALASGDTATRQAVLDQAAALLTGLGGAIDEVALAAAVGTALAQALGDQLLGKAKDRLGVQAVDANTLAYVTDQARLALRMLDSTASTLGSYCAGDALASQIYQYNCSATPLPRVLAIPHTNVRPLFDAVADLEALIGEAVAFADQATAASATAVAAAEAGVEAFLAGAGAVTGAGGGGLVAYYDSEFSTLFDGVDEQCARLQEFVDGKLVPAGRVAFAVVRGAGREARQGLEVVRVQSGDVGQEIRWFLRKRATIVGIVGISLAALVFTYALSLQREAMHRWLLRTCSSLSKTFSYGTLYVMLDVFVLFCFFSFFAVIVVASLESSILAACHGVVTRATNSTNSGRGNSTESAALARQDPGHRVVTATCVEVEQNLVPAVAALVAGGVLNFLLSYHLLAALQAAHFGDAHTRQAKLALDLAKKNIKGMDKALEKAASSARQKQVV